MAEKENSTDEWVPWDDPQIPELLWKQVRETVANCRVRLEHCPGDNETRDLMFVLLALSTSRCSESKWPPISEGTLAGSAKAYLRDRKEMPLGNDGPEASSDLASLFELLKEDRSELMQGFWTEQMREQTRAVAEAFVRRLIRNPEKSRLVTSNLGTLMLPDPEAVRAVEEKLIELLKKRPGDPEQLVIGCLVALGAKRRDVRNLFSFLARRPATG